MTSPLPLTPSSYRNRVQMSADLRFLLVEGITDKKAFQLLKSSCAKSKSEWMSLVITSAEDLGRKGGLGNRELVEQISRDLEATPTASRFAGLVDREFRDFGDDAGIEDRIGRHHVEGRTVWTRGHSLENYFFDSRVLEGPVRLFGVSDYYDQALMLFTQNLPDALAVACSASLAGRDIGQIPLVETSLSWDTIDISSVPVIVDVAQWRNNIMKKRGMLDVIADSLLNRFAYWLPVVRAADPDVVRWLCHGHIGFVFVWGLFAKCVYHVCQAEGAVNPEQQVQHFLAGADDFRKTAVTNEWISHICEGRTNYPDELLGLLGLSVQ